MTIQCVANVNSNLTSAAKEEIAIEEVKKLIEETTEAREKREKRKDPREETKDVAKERSSVEREESLEEKERNKEEVAQQVVHVVHHRNREVKERLHVAIGDNR